MKGNISLLSFEQLGTVRVRGENHEHDHARHGGATDPNILVFVLLEIDRGIAAVLFLSGGRIRTFRGTGRIRTGCEHAAHPGVHAPSSGYDGQLGADRGATAGREYRDRQLPVFLYSSKYC